MSEDKLAYMVSSVHGEDRLAEELNRKAQDGYELLNVDWVGGGSYRLIWRQRALDPMRQVVALLARLVRQNMPPDEAKEEKENA